MTNKEYHSFHIPVMGLGFTIDTPLKVARFGISSVISIIEDHLIERMREFHAFQNDEEYIPILINDKDRRAKRITAYLNLIERIVEKQMVILKAEPFERGKDIMKYFEMLPDESPLRKLFLEMNSMHDGSAKEFLKKQLRSKIIAGSIDVNIMTKVDTSTYAANGEDVPPENATAHSALRGFANSKLGSSVIFSAGMNPRLYSYCENFRDFFPDENGISKKKITLKVSDYRSALIQGKFLAKKGLWISEFRIESGLNCGGHAFATDGYLLGPILEEFRVRRSELAGELFSICNEALSQKGRQKYISLPKMKVTVQGGIGTAGENKFLIDHYEVDSTGWGSPFLLVPEVTNVDDETLHQLAEAKQEDYYLSHVSPLGVLFNNFHKSSSEKQRRQRVAAGRPGSPCYKKYLTFNTEFTAEPICTASRQYQDLKIKELKSKNLTDKIFQRELELVTEKDCLCEGLGVSALLKNHLSPAHELNAVSICPGPNLAYFSGVFSMQEMVNHIYGRINLLNSLPRANMFINELKMYVDYLKNEILKGKEDISLKQKKYAEEFRNNLIAGIDYYKNLIPRIKKETGLQLKSFKDDLKKLQGELMIETAIA
ncbi:MAG TPA: hypothetical protein VI757_10565 [Bacteroidia bacterium]|nr:hypothetical protein [Bacteroidia bacterium]